MSVSNLTISIIIPAYNEADNIVYCVKSALTQSVLPDEIIVVDNKSTDNTVELVNNLISEFELESPEHKGLIRVLHQNEYQGLVPTRNLGFNEAKSDILGRIDADAILSPEWVSSVKSTFSDSDICGATGPVTYYDMPMRRFSYKGDSKIRKLILDRSNDFPIMFGTNMAIRRTAWLKVANETCLDLEDVFHEDVDLSIHLALNDLKVVYVENMLAGMSARRIEDKYKDFVEYQERMLTTFTAHDIEPTLSAKLARLTFLALWFPLHAIRPIYNKRFERLRDDYLSDLWEDGGKMSSLRLRRAHKALKKAEQRVEKIKHKDES